MTKTGANAVSAANTSTSMTTITSMKQPAPHTAVPAKSEIFRPTNTKKRSSNTKPGSMPSDFYNSHPNNTV